MKVFLLANNFVGLQICKYLKTQDQIVGLAIHEPEKQRYTDEIIKAAALDPKLIFSASSLRDKKTINKIKNLGADIAISAFWGYILKEEFISLFEKGCINFHPGYLPYNRGMNPNVWPIAEQTPAGVTLHFIDPHIDTGDVIARKRVYIKENDTAESIYDKTVTQIIQLFKKEWPNIKKVRKKAATKQEKLGKSTFHWARDVNKLDKIELDKYYKGSDIINLLKARSYSDRFYSYYEKKGKKIYFRIEMGPVESAHPKKNESKNATYEKLQKIKSTHQPVTITVNSYVYLQLVTPQDGEDLVILKLLTKWRNTHKHAFPTQFKATLESTKKWLFERVINDEKRILFLLKDRQGVVIGHMGLSSFDFKNKSCEIDNVLRGHESYKGIMTNALKELIDWTYKELKVKKINLRVFSTNTTAIELYERCGFEKKELIPLRKEKRGKMTVWVEAEERTSEKAESNFLKMSHRR